MKRLLLIPLAALLSGCYTPPAPPSVQPTAASASISPTPAVVAANPTPPAVAPNPAGQPVADGIPTDAQFIAGVGLSRQDLAYSEQLMALIQRNGEAMKTVNDYVKAQGTLGAQLQQSQRLVEELRVEHVRMTATTPPALVSAHSMVGQAIALTAQSATQYQQAFATVNTNTADQANEALDKAKDLSIAASKEIAKFLEDAKKRAGQ